MTGPADPPEEFPPGTPIWTESDIAPMPAEAEPGTCPHCGHRFASIARRAQAGDAAVCQQCGGLLVMDESGWRAAYFDEAEAWDADPRVKAMRGALVEPPVPPEEPE